MERNSSTQFLKWNKFLDDEEYDRNKKSDYALARIAYEVRSLARAFGDKRELPPVEDFIPKFETGAAKPAKSEAGEEKVPEGIELDDIRSEEDLPEKWKVTNAIAKAEWARVLGATGGG